MKPLTYHGSKDVRVETVPVPVMFEVDDIILRVPATAICGSDLRMYRGKMPGLKDGDILRHDILVTPHKAREEAPAGYKLFDQEEQDGRKLVLLRVRAHLKSRADQHRWPALIGRRGELQPLQLRLRWVPLPNGKLAFST